MFLQELQLIIDEYENNLNEIEKVIFTKRYNLNKKHIEIFSVQSISMAYSVLEGFVQKSFSLYLEKLNNQDLTFDEISDSFFIYHMETQFTQFKNYPDKFEKKILFLSRLRESYSENSITLLSKVDTESNVGFEVINKILKQFSLEPFEERWSADYNHPNLSLKELMRTFLRYRNGVAHGGDLTSEEKVTQAVFSKYKKLVIDLMNGLYDKFEKGIEEKSFLSH